MQVDPLIGRQLANYKIERVIGRGGMAVVYFGRDVNLNRPAAIKVIDPRFRDQASYTGRFMQEARIIASWRHEHILQIYYADEQHFPDLGKFFFFAMEYIDGQNLAEVLAQFAKQDGAVPPDEVLKYGQAIAESLDYAHSNGIIHRDVKPANILVSKDGRVVLSDFGLALEVQQGSIGEVFGSAHYIAPEQARRSSEAVPQSDLYSLGVILYEMLTGVVPFDDPSPTSVALQHITLPPPLPRDVNPDLSEEVEAVLLKALAKKPEERFSSGAELISALENALIRMHPSLPALKQIPLPSAMQAAAAVPPASSPNPKQFPSMTFSQGKFAFIAVGLALIACLVVTLSVRVWQSGTAKRASVPPTAAVSLPAGALTTPAISQTASVPAAAPMTAPAPPSAVANDPLPALTGTTAPISDPAGAQPTLTWTPRFASGRKMLLLWNDSSFYMLQLSGYGELIEPLVFERLSAEGVPTNRFSAKLWAEMHASTLRDWCMRLELDGPNQSASLPAFLRPTPCEEHYLATRWPGSGDPTVFWTRQEGSRQFRILWGRDEIQRCEFDSGTCEVYLP